jgi:hypothetical protein
MIKKFVYSGVLCVVIALVAFLSVSVALSGSTMGKLPNENLTVPARNYSYLLINTSDASMAVASASLSSAINIYVFNATDFGLWRLNAESANSVGGLDYARTLYHGNSTFISANTAFMMPENVSRVIAKGSNSSYVYVVMDNTNGSASFGRPVTAKIVYLVLNPATNAKYHSLAMDQLYLSFAAFALLLVGMVLAVYGAMKSAKSAPAYVPTGKEAKNKAYIDSLYKNIESGKGNKKTGKSKAGKDGH